MTFHLFSIIPGTIMSFCMDEQQQEVVATGADVPQQAFRIPLDLECWQGVYLMGCQLH